MTDREKTIAEIREALKKATPEPWFFCEEANDIVSDKTDYIICENLQTKFDANLIVNAPEWLRFLLSELERKDKDIEILIDQAARELEAANRNWKEKCEENRKLQEEIAKLRGALQGAAQTANIAGAELKKLREERDSLSQQLETAKQGIERIAEDTEDPITSKYARRLLSQLSPKPKDT